MGISDRVRLLCEREGVSINKLETATGIGRGNVARWNEHKPGPDKLQAVAEYFHVPVDLLLGLSAESYLFDLEVEIAQIEKKIEKEEDEDALASLYSELEALEENKSDIEIALALKSTETKKSPSEDGDLAEYLSELRDRPEMRMLFHTFKGATKEQIEAIVAAWEAMNGRKE